MWTRHSPEACLALLLLAVAAAPAWPADDTAAQRQRIADEHTRIDAQARDAQAACAAKFAVAACINRVQAERRERLRRLDHDGAVLDGQQRKRRAAERLARIEQRQAVDAVAPAPVVKARRTAASPAGSAEAATAASAPAPRRHAGAASATAAQAAQAAAAQRAQASARRASEAVAHREAVELRLQKRSAQRAPAKPLPIPASAVR